jgi:hypothetical protein
VWEREECALHAMGEDTPGLLGPVSWQPNGRHIYAAAQDSSGAHQVALFERNGLAHGNFSTRTQGDTPICSLHRQEAEDENSIQKPV